MIILQYSDSTWRLPTSSGDNNPLRAPTSLRLLTTVPAPTPQGMDMPDSWDREDFSPFSEKELQALKIQAARKMMVKRWHDSLTLDQSHLELPLQCMRCKYGSPRLLAEETVSFRPHTCATRDDCSSYNYHACAYYYFRINTVYSRP